MGQHFARELHPAFRSVLIISIAGAHHARGATIIFHLVQPALIDVTQECAHLIRAGPAQGVQSALRVFMEQGLGGMIRAHEVAGKEDDPAIPGIDTRRRIRPHAGHPGRLAQPRRGLGFRALQIGQRIKDIHAIRGAAKALAYLIRAHAARVARRAGLIVGLSRRHARANRVRYGNGMNAGGVAFLIHPIQRNADRLGIFFGLRARIEGNRRIVDALHPPAAHADGGAFHAIALVHGAQDIVGLADETLVIEKLEKLLPGKAGALRLGLHPRPDALGELVHVRLVAALDGLNDAAKIILGADGLAFGFEKLAPLAGRLLDVHAGVLAPGLLDGGDGPCVLKGVLERNRFFLRLELQELSVGCNSLSAFAYNRPSVVTEHNSVIG